MPADAHRQRIERAFTDQAAAFEDSRFNRVFTTDAAWVFERVSRGPTATSGSPRPSRPASG